MNAVTSNSIAQTGQIDVRFDPAAVRNSRRADLSHCARELASEIGGIETDEDRLSVLMGLGALVAEVAALAVEEA